jgi:hypothetical protein
MMTLFSGKRLIGRAVAAGAILAAGMAAVPSARAADDLPMMDDEIGMPPPAPQYERPYYERPYSQQPYRPGPFAQGPYAAIPSARYNRPALDARPMIPPVQLVAILRSTGYSPLGQITQRGWIYTVAALDPDGDDGRLIIDARTGRIMRFIPAMAVDERLNDRIAMAYGPPGPPPATYAGYENRRGSLLDLRRSPRPPASVPKVTQRAAPKSASRIAPSAATPPSAAQRTAENKATAATVGAATTATPPSSPTGPSTLKLWPTQAMPDVQPLE